MAHTDFCEALTGREFYFRVCNLGYVFLVIVHWLEKVEPQSLYFVSLDANPVCAEYVHNNSYIVGTLVSTHYGILKRVLDYHDLECSTDGHVER